MWYNNIGGNMKICRICKQEKDDNLCCKKQNLCKKCKSNLDKEYRERNKEKLKKYFYYKWINDERRRIVNKNSKSMARNGVPYDYVLDKKCEMCGINNEEHLKKYGRSLNIHHINNTGRHNSKIGLKVDNTNIQVLCQSCHTKYGIREGKKSANLGGNNE